MSAHRGRPRLRLRRPARVFRAGAHRRGVPVTPWPEGWYGDAVPVARGLCTDSACPERVLGYDHQHLARV